MIKVPLWCPEQPPHSYSPLLHSLTHTHMHYMTLVLSTLLLLSPECLMMKFLKQNWRKCKTNFDSHWGWAGKRMTWSSTSSFGESKWHDSLLRLQNSLWLNLRETIFRTGIVHAKFHCWSRWLFVEGFPAVESFTCVTKLLKVVFGFSMSSAQSNKHSRSDCDGKKWNVAFRHTNWRVPCCCLSTFTNNS